MNLSNKGVTITDVAIAAAIFGLVMIVLGTGFRMITDLHKQAALVQLERDAQVELFQIAKEVRSARTVISVSSATLELSVYDLRGGYDVNVNTDIFDPVTFGTVTYQFTQGPDETYLKKSVDFPTQNPNTRKLLPNMLVAPDITNYIFLDANYLPNCPCETIDIVFRMNPAWFKKDPKTYQARATVRAFSGN